MKTSHLSLLEILTTLSTAIPNPKCRLVYRSAFELLVAVMLSARTTDEIVNRATAQLFNIASSPAAILALNQDKLLQILKSVGFYHTKTTHLRKMCQQILSDFKGEVPSTQTELMTLSGVGRKTANVVLNIWFRKPTIAVDTHVARVATRLGLVSASDPLNIESQLIKQLPAQYGLTAGMLLLLHGRYTCTAKKPKCSVCPFQQTCPSVNQFSHCS